MLFYRNKTQVIESKTILQQFYSEGKKMRTRKGFTLVEILIVVVILGILAAIVIPQFTNASTEAKESNLKSNLQTVRAQLELYKLRNNDLAPLDETTFVSVMTVKDINGMCYLPAIPVNPFTGGSSVAAWDAGTDWEYKWTGQYSGEFRAADDRATGGPHSTW
jgi:general secretion pathway protein G